VPKVRDTMHAVALERLGEIMPALRVAVVGSGPAGSSAAETLAKAGIETYLFERKLDNAKPCGGAIPLCMVSEFDLPPEIIDRRVRKMKMISPSNVEVDINIEKEHEYIGMCRREVLDGFLRHRAARLGAKLINGTVHKLDIPTNNTDPYTIHYADHSDGSLEGTVLIPVLRRPLMQGIIIMRSHSKSASVCLKTKWLTTTTWQKCMWVTTFPPTSMLGSSLNTTMSPLALAR